jgi:hypothetical protein
VEGAAVISIVRQKDCRDARKLSFCYLCGKSFSGDAAETDRDHVPPENVFLKEHREPLILPTHVACNGLHSKVDEKIGQLIGLQHSKTLYDKTSQLQVDFNVAANDLVVTNLDIDAAVWRWISGFHAALYKEPAIGIEKRGSLVVPLQRARKENGKYKAEPLRPQHRNFVETIKVNRLKGNLDAIETNKGMCRYECVWAKATNMERWFCVFALNIYYWKELGADDGSQRGCAGHYELIGSNPPANASIEKTTPLILPNLMPDDPFGP